MPTNLDDFSESGQWLRIGSLMLSILVIGLCWILLLTYFVSRMPAN